MVKTLAFALNVMRRHGGVRGATYFCLNHLSECWDLRIHLRRRGAGVGREANEVAFGLIQV